MSISGIIKNLVCGTVYLQAPLKAYELNEDILRDKYGINVRQIDCQNDNDIEVWKSIIHTSYDDCHYTTESARALLTNHPYMEDTQSFLFQTMSGDHIATVSIGRYRKNPMIGGDFRIGVTKSAQNKGYGRLCILFAFSKLASFGVKNGESAIVFKRKESLCLHYALGFRPQYNMNYVAAQKPHLKLKNLNFILKLRLFYSYRGFLKKERKKFIQQQ